MFMFFDELDDVAELAARPAAITLAAGIDVEGRPMIVVEGAQSLEGGPNGPQGDVAADDIDNVVRVLDLLFQRIVNHRAPGVKTPREADKSPSSVLREAPGASLAQEVLHVRRIPSIGVGRNYA